MQLKKMWKLKSNIKVIALANRKNTIEYGKKLSRDEVLIMLSDNIQELNHKIRYGKIRDKANARIKNAQMNSLVYLASNYLKGLKDETLDEIKQELLELKSGNISNDEFEQHIIDSVDNGVDLSEIERIESIIESFDGD